MKTRCSLLSVALISLIVIGCNSSDPCDDVDPVPTRVVTVALADAEHFRVQGASDGTTFYREITETEEIPVNEYLLAIPAVTIETDSQARCTGVGLLNESRIGGIEIYSDADFGANLPAGTPLGDTFQFVFGDLTPNPSDQTSQIRTSALLEQNTLSLDDYVNLSIAQTEPAPLIITLLLAAPVEIAREHVFTITYMLQNGDVFTNVAAPIFLGVSS